MSLRKLHAQVKTNKLSLKEAINQAYNLGSKLNEEYQTKEWQVLEPPKPIFNLKTPFLIDVKDGSDLLELIDFPNTKMIKFKNFDRFLGYTTDNELEHYKQLKMKIFTPEFEQYCDENGIGKYEIALTW